MSSKLCCLALCLASTNALAADPVKVPGKLAKALEGHYAETGGATFTIARTGKFLELRDLVDADGEAFEVTENRYVDGHFAWTYHVPSTGFVVGITVLSATRDAIETSWTNADDSGLETIARVRD